MALTSTGAAARAAVGSYSIIPSAAVGTGISNYTITYANGTLSVTKVPLRVTAPSPNRAYGAANATLTPTYTGFVAGDTAASLTTAPTCVTTATAASPVGAYRITCSGGVSANYSITYAAGTLTVNKAVLTVTANNRTKTYGTALTLGSTAFATSGLVNGDTVARVTLTSTGAAARAAVGTYSIVPSAAVGTGLSNYTITYVSGTLKVTRP